MEAAPVLDFNCFADHGSSGSLAEAFACQTRWHPKAIAMGVGHLIFVVSLVGVALLPPSAFAAPSLAAAPTPISMSAPELLAQTKRAVQFKQADEMKAVVPPIVAALAVNESWKPADQLSLQLVPLLRGLLDSAEFAVARELANAWLSNRKQSSGTHDIVSAAAFNALGEADFEAGEFRRALEHFERARDLREEVLGPKSPAVAESLNNIGAALQLLGRNRDARSNYMRALSIREAALGKNHRDVGESMNNLATLALATANYAEAEVMFKRAVSLWEVSEGPNAIATADALNNLGELYREVGDVDRARQLLERAMKLRISKLGESAQPVAESLNNLALLFERLGNAQDAESHYRKAIELMAKHGGPKYPPLINAKNNLGVMLTRAGKFESALPLFEDSLAARRETLGHDHPSTARSLDNLAQWYMRQGRIREARPLLVEALATVDSHDNLDARWRVLGSLFQLEIQAGNSDAAALYGKRAVNTIQSMRIDMASMDGSLRQTFLRDKADLYRQLFDLLVANARLSEAQQVLRMLKEEEYFDFVRRQGPSDLRTAKIDLSAAEAEAVQTTEGVSRGIAKSGAELKRLRAKPMRTDEEERRVQVLAAEVNTARSAFNLALSEIQRSFSAANVSTRRAQEVGAMNLSALRALQGTLQDLGDGVVLVNYIVHESRIHILLTTPAIQVARSVEVDRTQLNLRVQQFRERLESPRRDAREAARRVYDLVLAPIAEDLVAANARTILLSLDGVLRYIPFAALFDGDRFLIEKYQTVLFAEAARDKLKDKRVDSWRVAGMGVSRSVENFPALPGVVDELRAIVRTKETPRGTVPGTIILNQTFSRPTLISALGGGYSVLHLASHFVLNAGVERDSYLLLGDKSRLTLREMREEDFDFRHIDLVALSACETAVGGRAEQAGMEVEGLSTQVQIQGAKGVLATLWRVHDESTALIMQRFYRLRVEGKLSKADALREAQLSLLRISEPAKSASTARSNFQKQPATVQDRRFRHPYFWAPFVLAGNWR